MAFQLSMKVRFWNSPAYHNFLEESRPLRKYDSKSLPGDSLLCKTFGHTSENSSYKIALLANAKKLNITSTTTVHRTLCESCTRYRGRKQMFRIEFKNNKRSIY